METRRLALRREGGSFAGVNRENKFPGRPRHAGDAGQNSLILISCAL
jgi:hypothetical protein